MAFGILSFQLLVQVAQPVGRPRFAVQEETHGIDALSASVNVG